MKRNNQCQILPLGWGSPGSMHRSGGCEAGEHRCRKGWGSSGWKHTESEPEVCPGRQRGQQCPGMHQSQHCWPVTDCLAVLCTGATSPTALGAVLHATT